jgi:hypothetical protein
MTGVFLLFHFVCIVIPKNAKKPLLITLFDASPPLYTLEEITFILYSELWKYR